MYLVWYTQTVVQRYQLHHREVELKKSHELDLFVSRKQPSSRQIQNVAVNKSLKVGKGFDLAKSKGFNDTIFNTRYYGLVGLEAKQREVTHKGVCVFGVVGGGCTSQGGL